jgi:ATP-dependent Lon protease
LEVLDPEQNNAFVDNFFTIPVDLSKVLFITTANDTSTIPQPLFDRMEIIELSGYSPYEKLHIALNHLIPKQKDKNGIKDLDVSFSKNALNKIINEYTFEGGVRTLERECGSVLRKVAVLVASDKVFPKTIKPNHIKDYLGKSKIRKEVIAPKPEVGLCAGLAATSVGGSLLFLETALTHNSKGEGRFSITGNLGKVLQESAELAYTWIKTNAEEFDVSEALANNDVHIHMPQGATPKDGPSAGVALTAVILSALSNRPIKNEIAMTGEISLRGDVLPIGGVSKKVMGAHMAGVKQILLPHENMVDLDEVPDEIKKDLVFTPIKHVKEALEILLIDEKVEKVALEQPIN